MINQLTILKKIRLNNSKMSRKNGGRLEEAKMQNEV
jgi:hypothetical protein